MRASLRGALLVSVALALVSCAAVPRVSHVLPAPGEPFTPVWVVGHGWHVGLAVRRADVRRDVWAEAHALGPFDYVEVGWGDGEFYPAVRGTVTQALKAAFRSASSVLHVAAFDGRVEDFFARAPIVELRLTPAGFDELCRYIAAAYARSGDGHVRSLRHGLYGASHFYQARDPYHVFDNSNQWATRGLRRAGVPVSPSLSLYGGTVFAQIDRLGIVHRGAP